MPQSLDRSLSNDGFSIVLSSVTIPVKRILNKPQIVRSLGSSFQTNVSLSHSPVAGRSLQRSRHKPLYDANHQIRVSLTVKYDWVNPQTELYMARSLIYGY